MRKVRNFEIVISTENHHVRGKFLLSDGFKKFDAHFDHDVGMKRTLQVLSHLTNVQLFLYDALNAY